MSGDRTNGGPLSAFRNLKTATKLLAGFLAVSMLMVGVGVLGITKLASAQAGMQSLYRDSFQAIAWLGKVDKDSEETRRRMLELALAPTPAAKAKIRVLIVGLDASVDANWALYTATDMRGREKFRNDLNDATPQYRKLRDERLIPLIEAGRIKEFGAVRDALVSPLIARISADIASLYKIEDKAAIRAVADSKSAYQSARMLIIGLILAAFALSVGLALGIGRTIARPLKQTVQMLEGLAEGHLDLRLDVDTKDEVGQMAGALNRAMTRLQEAMRAMGNNSQGVAAASEELSAVSGQMRGSAQESANQAGVVSAAAEQVSISVQTVAAGTEQMSASIREIAKNTSDAAGVAMKAVDVAESANVTVAKLGESSAEIGNVIKVINSIAEQTNLLALNATIEAARAGEAGKGFAVVASEVKELARETSKATEDIGRRIEAIQVDTRAAVDAISQISAIIEQINDTQSTIASAVEEQTATTNEMSRSVTDAASGSTDIASNIIAVARSADDTTAAANSTSEAAAELARMAGDLQQLVGQFRC